MSRILNLASVRYFRHLPVRGLHYNGLNPSLKVPVLTPVNCIMPRSPETWYGLARSPNNLKMPDGFSEIYYFKEQKAIRLASMGATVLALFTVWSFYTYKTESKDPVSEEEKAPQSESPDFSGMRSWWGNILAFRPGSLEMKDSDKIYNFLILPLLVTLLLYSRTSVVLSSYRRGGEYVTSVTKRFGFGCQIVRHGPGEVIYYPHRMIYKHELQGQKVLLFPEYFVNSDEEQKMCIGNDTDFKRGTF